MNDSWFKFFPLEVWEMFVFPEDPSDRRNWRPSQKKLRLNRRRAGQGRKKGKVRKSKK